jgi:sugar phosphate isomerase/epimerase
MGDSSMMTLAAFADEISPNLDIQIEHLKKHGISFVELRGVAGQNVLDFDPALRHEIKTKLADHGLAVACIGSPIGKVKLNEPFEKHFDRFKIAVELAGYFGTSLIRIFSYYPAEGGNHADLVAQGRAEVLHRMQRKLEYVQGQPFTLVHENEANIYGEKAAQCLDLHQQLPSPQFRAAFDFANFVQAGENPAENWPLLKPYTSHIHVKDALMGSGKTVLAGEGDGHIGEILKDAWASGYRGYLSIEPHLAAHGQFSGFSGPELFARAVDAVRHLARANGIPLDH